MIDNTSDYKERRLSNIIESLRILDLSELLPQASFGNEYTIDERECLKRCLKTCVRVSESIKRHQGASIKKYHEKLTATIAELKEFLKAIDSQNVTASPSDLIQSVQADKPILRTPEQVHQRDWESENVNVNRFDDICVAEDGNQIITSTAENLIQAKNISAGPRSVQCLGLLSDASLEGVLRTVTQPR